MLSLDQQEAYRRRYARVRPGWRPGSHIYQDAVAARLTPATRVLDLGCGRGGVMERLHSQAGLVAGLDPDLGSLREHRTPALALTNGLAKALPYADNSFDMVSCSWVLEHLPEPERAFAEVARILVPGGHFVFLTPNAHHPLLVLNRALGWTRGRLVGQFYDRARVSLRFIGDPTYLATRPTWPSAKACFGWPACWSGSRRAGCACIWWGSTWHCNPIVTERNAATGDFVVY